MRSAHVISTAERAFSSPILRCFLHCFRPFLQRFFSLFSPFPEHYLRWFWSTFQSNFRGKICSFLRLATKYNLRFLSVLQLILQQFSSVFSTFWISKKHHLQGHFLGVFVAFFSILVLVFSMFLRAIFHVFAGVFLHI